MSTQEIKRVGVIGLGKMGLPMARRLAERGFAVIGYDVALAALKAAAAAGVQPVNSPKAVAATSDLTALLTGGAPAGSSASPDPLVERRSRATRQ